MAYRTTKERVEAAVEGFDHDIWNSSFLDTANVLVNRLVEQAPGEHDADDLRIIETYIAAHAYALKDPQYKSKSTDRASATFEGVTGKYLEFTRYGMMAIAADHTGTLKAMTGGTHKVGVYHVG